jgi:CheY-like chemotaxis protein
MTDPVAFEQVVLNLCTNARDAMPVGGVLEVTLDRRRVAPDPAHTWRIPGEHVALIVQDSGIGMSPEAQARVFEPFYTTKSAGQGTGLGMAMVYGLARQQGGFVELESQVGRGTTVTVYLPLAASPEGREATRQPEPRSGRSGGHETILLVEDEPALRRAAERILQRLGYDVLLARDGEEAVAIMETEGTRVDLVLADVVLPKLSGGKFLELLRDRGWRGRILLTSGYSVSDAAWAGVSMAEEIPFLPKPWTFDDLARKVREVLDAAPPA